MSLEGVNALVTGSTSGIGESIAMRSHPRGARWRPSHEVGGAPGRIGGRRGEVAL